MSITPATIDRIVADVLAQLGESPVGVPPSGGASNVVGEPSVMAVTAPTKPKAFDLDLSHASVLTGEMLETLDIGASIRVGKALVLTPSARDVVTKRSLRLLDNAPPQSAAAAAASTLKPHLLVVTSTPETRALADTLKQAGWAIDYPGCDGDAIKAARSAVCRGETNFAAIIAPRPNRTAQRLNRTRNVLAAAVLPESNVSDLQAEGDWNVACLAADRWASFRLKKTLETLAKGAAG